MGTAPTQIAELGLGQPGVGLHRALGAEGEDGVGAAEGDKRGAGEEQALGGEHAVGAGQCDNGSKWETPGGQPYGEDLESVSQRGLGVMEGVVRDEWRRPARLSGPCVT